jgi:hypothetical protein
MKRLVFVLLLMAGCLHATTPDAYQFVSPNGSDTNDGYSWATAKLTYGAAQSAMITAGRTVATIYLSPSFSETFTSTVTIGDATHFMHVEGTGWSGFTCNVNNVAANCINISSGSSLNCEPASATTRTTNCTITSGSSMNVADVVNIGGSDAGQINFSGWGITDQGGGRYSGYLLHIANGNQPMVVRGLNIVSTSGKGLGIVGAGTGIVVENTEVNAVDTGGVPCTIDTSSKLDSVWLYNLSCEHALDGSPEISIDPSHGELDQLVWRGGRVESAPNSSSTTEMVDIAGGGISIYDLDTINEGTGSAVYTYQIENQAAVKSVVISPAAEGSSTYVVHNLKNGFGAVPFIHQIPRYEYYTFGANNYSNVGPAAGTCTLAAGICAHTFTYAFVIAPTCTAVTQGTPIEPMKVTATTAAVTVQSASGTDSSVVGWVCYPPVN